ncbi:bifunctional 2-polyprenyl-6-hydroxyphenol methylase/3-demethylubiquinol 3-O-methyltransferase UbiG [uncultured Clostridium sp.]|uniref:class I SAM-dependent methyltransferase n=1 Tax=uncultured Clostridium sp. TaxID=59620 RepID=UPI0025FDC781|nr:class I SAM-dependent methyltransferase [uncultured Clostridium sp.]
MISNILALYYKNLYNYIRIIKNKNIVIFGAGNGGKVAQILLKNFFDKDIECFVDNYNYGYKIRDKYVYCFDDFIKCIKNKHYLYLICSEYCDEISSKLKYYNKEYLIISKPQLLNIKGEEDSAYYDEMYEQGGFDENYFKHYSETIYFNVWKKAIEYIKNISNPSIIDIGCGVGQFANFIFDNGITNYKGIDFSKKAIEIAKIRNDKYRRLFKIDNIYTTKIFNDNYNIVIMFETLEHLNEDLKILYKIRKNSNVIFSVPNFMARGHVRCFKSESDIIKRYKKLVYVDDISRFDLSVNNEIFLVKSQKI